MNLGYVLFLVMALCLASVVLIRYIQLQADITALREDISANERTLNNLRVANDEAYNRINSNLNLEEIRRIAIGELGMVYPEAGQIINYTNEGYDYVRKVTDDN